MEEKKIIIEDMKDIVSDKKEVVVASPLDASRADAKTYIAAMRKAIEDNDMKAFAKAESSLKETEKEYNAISAKVLMDELKHKPDPILASLSKHRYIVLTHKATKNDDGSITNVELFEENERSLSLKKMCDYLHISTTWALKAEKAGKLLCLRAAKELGKSAEEIKAIETKYRIDKVADHEDLGKTPDSTTKIKTMLQRVLDAVPFTDETRAEHAINVRAQDVNYLLFVAHKAGKEERTVDFVKPEFFISKIFDVLTAIVLNLPYDINFREAK